MTNEKLARKTAQQIGWENDSQLKDMTEYILSALNEAGKAETSKLEEDARELLDRLERCADEEEGDITRKYCAEMRKRYPRRE